MKNSAYVEMVLSTYLHILYIVSKTKSESLKIFEIYRNIFPTQKNAQKSTNFGKISIFLIPMFLEPAARGRIDRSTSNTVLPFLAIYRQIRDFGLLFGDGKFELAIYRQSPKFRDFEPQRLAKSAKFEKQWRFWRYWIISG